MKVIAKPIEMIAWTEEDGKVHPLKFKIATNDEKLIYRIAKIYHTENEKIAGNKLIKFTCEVRINGITKVCEIRYELDSCKWVMFKI